MQPEVFTCRLQEALRSQAQPHLLTFLQKVFFITFFLKIMKLNILILILGSQKQTEPFYCYLSLFYFIFSDAAFVKGSSQERRGNY